MFLPLLLALAADPGPPQVLYIYRDFPKPGSDDEYREIEKEAARICAAMTCPNPYIGIESLTGAKEAWWINSFPSEEAMNRVANEYATNKPLAEALNQIAQRKSALIGKPSEGPARYRADLSRGQPWQPGRGRFLVIAISKTRSALAGTVFEASDGTRFTIAAARSRAEADANAAEAGSKIRVFGVRPYWSMPSKEWIAADPEFWRTAPVRKVK